MSDSPTFLILFDNKVLVALLTTVNYVPWFP
jgi:hypothetical protein